MEINDLKIGDLDYTERLEVLNNKMMELMRRQTGLYGGNKIVDDMKEQVVKTYYEGLGRKFERMPSLLKKYMEHGEAHVLDTIIDTIADINGYALMSLVDMSYHARD